MYALTVCGAFLCPCTVKATKYGPVIGCDDFVIKIPRHCALPFLHLLLQATLHLEGLALFFNLLQNYKFINIASTLFIYPSVYVLL